jgi:hypothetical protein
MSVAGQAVNVDAISESPSSTDSAAASRKAAARPRWLVPLVLGAIVFAVSISSMGSYPVGVFLDDGIYVTLAKALATGQGFHYLNLPGQPAATHYPPGYPAFLALLWMMFPSFPENVVVFKAANAILLALTAVAALHFARVRLRLPLPPAFAVVLAFSIPIPILWLAGLLLSETLFLALLIPTLMFAERSVERGGLRDALLLGVIIGVLILVRTLGIALLPAVALCYLVRRRVREAALFAIAAIVVMLPWQIWVSRHALDLPPVLRGTYGSYTAWLADAYRELGLAFAFSVVRLNLKELGDTVAGFFSLTAAPISVITVRATIVVLLALGLWGLRKLAPVTAWFIAGYCAIVFLWPFRPTRFMEGIWVLLGLTLTVGVRAIIEWKDARPPLRVVRGVGLAASALVAIGYLAYNARWYPKRGWERYEQETAAAAAPLLRWTVRHTAPTDIIASDGGAILYLYTGRQTVPLGEFTAVEYVREGTLPQTIRSMQDVLAAYDVRYVMVTGGSSAKAAEKLLYATPPELAFVDTLPKGGAVLAPRR